MTSRAARLFAATTAVVLSLGSSPGLAAPPGTREVVEEVGPPRPNWLGSRRGVAGMRAATVFAAKLARPAEALVACEPTCATTGLRATEGRLGTAASTEDGAKRAFAGLALAGELAAASDLHLAGVRTNEGVREYSFLRGEGPVACDCSVTVVIRDDGAVVRATGRKLLGYGVLPREPRYTRGEAFEAATHQLVAESPSLTEPNGLANPELSAVIVVPVGDRAALAHRFALRLDRLPYVVDVDDATLEVVRVAPDRRFDRVETIVHDVNVVETVMPRIREN